MFVREQKGTTTMFKKKYTALSLLAPVAVAAVIGCMVGQTGKKAGDLTPAAVITEQLDGSPTYINKILQALVRADVLESRKGARGGFSIKRSVTEVTLRDVVSPFEDFDVDTCAIDGGGVCTGDQRCGMHNFWAGVRSEIVDTLKRTTLRDFHLSER